MSTPVIEKYIYFVRHGQSEENLDPVFQGPDTPLTTLGREQARFVADRIQSVDAQVLLSSPMPRALETAGIIHSVTGTPLETQTLFREYIPPTSLSGKSKDLPEGQRYLREQREHMHDPSWHFEDEDNYYDLHHRALEAMEYLIARPEQRMVVVTHVGITRVLITAMLTEGVADVLLAHRFARFLKPQNTGITLVRYRSDATRRNQWRLLTWNDHAHLAETHLAEPLVQEVWEEEPGEL
jgi:phosphoserine phosphatase